MGEEGGETGEREGNTEEENNGYVVITCKNPRISWEIGQGRDSEGEGEALLRPPTPLSTSRLLEKYIKTT